MHRIGQEHPRKNQDTRTTRTAAQRAQTPTQKKWRGGSGSPTFCVRRSGRSNCKKTCFKNFNLVILSTMCGSPRIHGWLFVGTAKRSRLTAVQDGRSARATQACVPRRKKETIRASMRTHCVSGLRAPKAFKKWRSVICGNQCPRTRNVSPPSRCCPCPNDGKGNLASCSSEPPASCAWSLCSGCTSACHVPASSYEDLLAKTRWPL